MSRGFDCIKDLKKDLDVWKIGSKYGFHFVGKNMIGIKYDNIRLLKSNN